MLEAFPSWDWNEAGNVNALQSVLGFENDELGRLRLLDQGKIDYEPQPQGAQKLIVWDLKENRLIDAIPIPEEAAPARTSFLADLAIGNRGGFVYISDAGSGWPDHPVKAGIIVYDMRRRTFRRVLDCHYSTQDLPGFRFAIDTRPVLKNAPLRIGVDAKPKNAGNHHPLRSARPSRQLNVFLRFSRSNFSSSSASR